MFSILTEMKKIQLPAFVVLVTLTHEIATAASTNISEWDICRTDCICDYSTRDCGVQPRRISLDSASQSVNASTQVFKINNCYSDGDFTLQSIAQASSSLRILRINNCKIGRIRATNDSVVAQFENLVDVDLSRNYITDIEIDALGEIATKLVILNLSGNAVSGLIDFSVASNLRNLDLSRNQYFRVPKFPSSLRVLNLSRNSIHQILREDFKTAINLETLDLSYCEIDGVHESAFENLSFLKTLLLNGNRIRHLPSLLFSPTPKLGALDLSRNRLDYFDASLLTGLTELRSLLLAENPIDRLAPFPAPSNLTTLSLAETHLIYFDLRFVAEARNLRELILSNNGQLRSCVGAVAQQAPSLRRLDLRNCALTQLQTGFFENVIHLDEIQLAGNPWACDCRDQWIHGLMLIPNISVAMGDFTTCPNRTDAGLLSRNNTVDLADLCSIGTAVSSGTIQRTTHGSDLILDCGVYGDPSPTVVWEQPLKNSLVGQWPGETVGGGKLEVLPGGLLLVRRATGQDVGPYQCTIYNNHGNASSIIFLRLDYSNWWEMKLYSAVCGIITAIGFFILNVIYASIRRLIIWRISKLEQTSRVRLLLEAMEKYRQRQLDGLHEKYNAKMHQIRENCHTQVDQMRRSYLAQAGRFRDYRAAQMEYVSQHIESLRDNYSSQASRVREYGGRQMERLWESYQRQVNRLRAFSLQQRLRLMRQYKIKQRYWNKMFESINVEAGLQQRNGHIPVAIHPELIELPELPTTVEDLRPGTSGRTERDSLMEEFDDALSNFAPNDMEEADALSYHSAQAEAFEPTKDAVVNEGSSDGQAIAADAVITGANVAT